ncbi:MAG TPA: low temperature requirement protein A, partial [Longimicrobiaceae bacterium]|nr:low temperature requirement protein A [Longimicrobiaceae bacterium]
MGKVAFVTYDRLTELSPDDQRAVAALRGAGVEVEAAVWSDPTVEWGAYGAVVVRSCWDYWTRPAEFAAWIDRMEAEGAPLWNPPAVLRWNMDKWYLRELEAREIPVTPTEWIERGAEASLAGILARRGWERAVVKPRVSANAYQTWTTSRGEAGALQSELDRLLAGTGVMVQPFVEEIQRDGEWSLVFFRSRFSHAVVKRPAHGEFRVQPNFGGTVTPAVPTPEIVLQAERALAAAPDRTLLARDAYTYGHVLIVAGIVLSAVGDELVIAHPTDELPTAELVAVAGGPTLYLLAQGALRLRMTGAISVRRLGGAAACVLVGILGTAVSALVVGALLVAVLIGVIVADQIAGARRAASAAAGS